MSYLKTYTEYLNEKNESGDSLKKIYLATKRSSGQQWLTYKGFAGNKFFIQVTEDNMDDLDINPDFPVLNYHGDITKSLLEKGLIRDENIYNHPKHISKSGSKEEFHKLTEGDEHVPMTVYSEKDALEKLKFPIIAKPSSGHSGLGIQIFKSAEDLKDSKGKFDTFSEYIDKAEEHRFMTFKGEPIFWMERTPLNEKAKAGNGKADEAMEFGYKKRKISGIPEDMNSLLSKFSKIYKDLPYICFDIMRSKDNKLYVIEPNSQPGVPFDSTVKIYEKIYEDFYKEPVDKNSQLLLDKYADQMINLTIKKDKDRFSVEF